MMDTKENIISVIVPVYQTQAYLSRCVDSLLAQKEDGFSMELILVDDGSPDDCGVRCDDYAKKDSRVFVIHKENGGLVSAWKAGVEASKGTYLCFVDSDDWVEETMLFEMARHLTGIKREVICCNFLVERSKGASPHRHGAAPGVYEGEALQQLQKNLLGHENRTVSLSRCMKLIGRSLIMDNKQYANPRIRMGEDVNIMLPVMLDATRVVIMDEAYYYHYFFNDASMAHKYDKGLFEGIRLLYETILKISLEKGMEEAKERCGMEYIHLLLLAVKNEIRGNRQNALPAIRAIAEDAETRRVLSRCPVQIKDKAGKLLYGILKSPTFSRVTFAKFLFSCYDHLHS